MKLIPIILILFLAACSFDQPTYRLDKEIIDLGKLEKNDPAIANFTLFNSGKVDLKVEKVLTDCHCTIASVPDFSINPGDSVILKINYDKNRKGFFEQTASVYFKDIDYPQLLIIRGDVK